MSLETCGTVEVQPGGQRVVVQCCRARSESIPGDDAPKRRTMKTDLNEKCMYLHRSQEVRQAIQVRDHQGSAMMFEPFCN